MYRGTPDGGIYASTPIIPGTHQNRIQGVGATSYVYYEAYFMEGMGKEESIALEQQWRVLIGKSLRSYSVVGPAVIVKDFEKTKFTSNGARLVTLTLYHDLNKDAFRLGFSIKALSPKGGASTSVKRAAQPVDAKKTSGNGVSEDRSNMDAFKKNIGAIILARKMAPCTIGAW